MTAPYLAPSLAVLRAELNARWPRRDHTSDGWIGDTRHQATKSDHNPNSRGSVNAIDVDEDGVDFGVVFAAIKRHPSARYVIYERRLYHRLRGWKAEPYYGVNPHDHHFHLSIDQTVKAEQDRRPWGLLEDDMDPQEIAAAVWQHQFGSRALEVPARPAADWAKAGLATERKVDALAAELAAQRKLLEGIAARLPEGA